MTTTDFTLTPRPAMPIGALVPDGWSDIDGLVCGFGDRRAAAPTGTVLLRKQVHGSDIASAASPLGDAHEFDGYPRVAVDADALVAAGPGLVAGVRTADCVPLLLVAPGQGWSAAVHAGWRGTLAGIATAAVAVARSKGVAPAALLAALGPSIGPCCYEVSEELGRDFAGAGLPVHRPATATGGTSKPRLDLRAANRMYLERAGVPAANIQAVGPCTRCAKDRYHSYRAEPESAGRQVSWIGWAARKPSPGRGSTR
ncbi:MAG: polyphenol oxidase family protein [Candidatus Binatia bacterium]